MWAVLPLKDFVSAKQRLSGVLSASERRRLFHAMVEDVLSVLTQAPSINGIVVVSDDPTAALMAKQYRVTLVAEPEINGPSGLKLNNQISPLNAAITAGCKQVLHLAGDTDICILHADLPELSITEIERIAEHRSDLSRSDQRDSVTIVSDRHQTGTNTMVLNSAHFLPLKIQQRQTLNRQLFHFGHNPITA